jgi:hypothetical protein
VDAVSRDRDGVLRVVRDRETGTLDPATGTLRGVQRSRGRVVWIGADSEIVQTATGALVRRAHGGGIDLGKPVLETDGDFVLVRDAGIDFLLDARTGRRIVDVTGAWPEPSVRFVAADRVFVAEAGELAMLGVTGTIKPCGKWWLASGSDHAAITKPVAVQWSSRHAALDPATCTVTREPARASPVRAGTEEVGGLIRGIPRIVEESSGDAVWKIGEQALVRRHRGGGTLRIATKDVGIDLAMEMELGEGGLLDVDSINRNLRQVSAGGGRVALLWKTGSATITDGTTRWHVPVGETAAAVALAPDGKLLAAVGPRELVWFDVESGHVIAEAWRQGSVWRTRRHDRVVGDAVPLGQPSGLVWRVEDIRLPGFVAWSRQGAAR